MFRDLQATITNGVIGWTVKPFCFILAGAVTPVVIWVAYKLDK